MILITIFHITTVDFISILRLSTNDVGILEVNGELGPSLLCVISKAYTDKFGQPKYWCKHCKTYVRDTKLEKTSHEATPKHQGNLKRFLRDLHRGHEREERDKQRAKSEVERLNGVVTGVPAVLGGSTTPWKRKTAIPSAPPEQRQASVVERKQQLAQLADMGVAIPDEFRREMAMAGDWQTLSETPIYEASFKKEEDVDVKPVRLSMGVRKRRHEGQEEDEEAREPVVRKAWGSTFKTYSEADQNADDDLDSLLASTGTKMNRRGRLGGSTEAFGDSTTEDNLKRGGQGNGDLLPGDGPIIKREDSGDGTTSVLKTSEINNPTVGVKQEDDALVSAVLFKKRKVKTVRQK